MPFDHRPGVLLAVNDSSSAESLRRAREIARAKLGNQQDVDDVVQDAVVNKLTRAQAEDVRTPQALDDQIVRNAAADRGRKLDRQRKREATLDTNMVDRLTGRDDVLDRLIPTDQQVIVALAKEFLDDRNLDVVFAWHRYREGAITRPELADELGLSQSSVKAAVRTAKVRFRAAVFAVFLLSESGKAWNGCEPAAKLVTSGEPSPGLGKKISDHLALCAVCRKKLAGEKIYDRIAYAIFGLPVVPDATSWHAGPVVMKAIARALPVGAAAGVLYVLANVPPPVTDPPASVERTPWTVVVDPPSQPPPVLPTQPVPPRPSSKAASLPNPPPPPVDSPPPTVSTSQPTSPGETRVETPLRISVPDDAVQPRTIGTTDSKGDLPTKSKVHVEVTGAEAVMLIAGDKSVPMTSKDGKTWTGMAGPFSKEGKVPITVVAIGKDGQRKSADLGKLHVKNCDT
jgi:DNA-directed RNA polymerase specialized sigma24 family protein